MESPKRQQRTYREKNIERTNTKPSFMNDKGKRECDICSISIPANYLVSQRGKLICGRCVDSK